MCEGMRGALFAQRHQHGVVSDLAKRQERDEIRQGGDLRLEELVAGENFGRDRLVLGWNAAHGIGDNRILQL